MVILLATTNRWKESRESLDERVMQEKSFYESDIYLVTIALSRTHSFTAMCALKLHIYLNDIELIHTIDIAYKTRRRVFDLLLYSIDDNSTMVAICDIQRYGVYLVLDLCTFRNGAANVILRRKWKKRTKT